MNISNLDRIYAKVLLKTFIQSSKFKQFLILISNFPCLIRCLNPFLLELLFVHIRDKWTLPTHLSNLASFLTSHTISLEL